MYRILFLLLTLFFAVENSMAQSAEDIVAPKHSDFAGMDEAENPDEAGAAMPSIGISVILIGETKDWYKVIMYNNKEAYIQKKYVRTTKLFMDETVARNQMNKTLSIELDDLLAKFEDTLSNSNYTKKNQIRPMFKLVDAKKIKNIVTLTFFYSCADTLGHPIPSYNDNDLSAYMQQLLELVLGRLILSPAEEFKIVIKVPTYDDKGNVVDDSKEYAVISLNPANVNMEEVRSKNISILSLAQSTIPINDLFKTYPR